MGVSLGLRAEVQAGMPSSSGCVTPWSQESSSTIKFSGHWADSWCALTEVPTFIGNNGNGLHNVNIMAWQTTTLVIALSGMATSEDLEKITSFQSSDEKHKEWNKIWDVKDCSSPCWAPQYSTVRKHLFADVSRDKSSFSYLPALIQVEKQKCGILPQNSYSTHRQGVTWVSPYGKWSRTSQNILGSHSPEEHYCLPKDTWPRSRSKKHSLLSTSELLMGFSQHKPRRTMVGKTSYPLQ